MEHASFNSPDHGRVRRCHCTLCLLPWHVWINTYALCEQINGFFGQPQFAEKFGDFNPTTGKKEISAAWQSGLSNSALVGELAGLVVNFFATDRFGCRRTYIFFMVWLACAIFISVFAPSLSVLAFGEAMSGISWGVFQVLQHLPIILCGGREADCSRLLPRHTPARLYRLSCVLS